MVVFHTPRPKVPSHHSYVKHSVLPNVAVWEVAGGGVFSTAPERIVTVAGVYDDDFPPAFPLRSAVFVALLGGAV